MTQESPRLPRTSARTAMRVGFGLAWLAAATCAVLAWYSDRTAAFATSWIFAWIAVVHLPEPQAPRLHGEPAGTQTNTSGKSSPALAIAWGALPLLLLQFGELVLTGLKSFPLTDLGWILPRGIALSVPIDRFWVLGFFLLGATFALVARWMSASQTTSNSDATNFALGARWLRLGAWVALALSIARGLAWFGYPQFERFLEPALRWLVLLLALEMLFRGVLELFRGKSSREGRIVLADSPLLGFVAARLNPLGSIYGAARELFGIDVTGTIALQVVRRSLLPLALGALILGWALTAVQMIQTDEEGLWLRFGKLKGEIPLQPGLHLVLPWPIDEIRRVATGRVHSLPIGYRGQTAESSLLWTSRHATEEYSLLLGDGNDLIAVNGLLNYRITDANRFALSHQNPEAALVAIADRVLLEQTHGASLDQVLSENLSDLTARIEAAIRAELERVDMGLELNDLSLIGLHPPVDVATDYQDVNSSAILRETMRVEGETYAIETLPAANATAHRMLRAATAYQSKRLAQANGQAAAFDAVEHGYRLSPRLFKFRAELESLERTLADRTYYIIDDRIERDGGSLWLLD